MDGAPWRCRHVILLSLDPRGRMQYEHSATAALFRKLSLVHVAKTGRGHSEGEVGGKRLLRDAVGAAFKQSALKL